MNWQSILNFILSFFNSRNSSPASITLPFDGTQLILIRDTYTQFSTQGTLSINGSFEAYTIECPKESYEGSHVCIPCGTYFIELVDSPKHGPNTPQLKDVPGRTNVQIHSSNWAINPETKQVFLLGCIAPGTAKDPNVVYNSKIAVADIMAKIDWTKKVQIAIVEN